MKTDPNLCPPPPESGEGRRPSDRPSPVTALGGTPETAAPRHALGSRAGLGSSALGGATLGGPTGDRSAVVERRLRAVHWSELPPAREQDDGDASGERAGGGESAAEDDLTPSTSGEFDPYRFGSHMLPYEFLQDALKEPLRAPRDEDLLHETLPPYASAHPTPLSPSVSAFAEPDESTQSVESTLASVAPLGSMPPAASVPPVVVDPKKTLVTGLRLSPEAVQRLRGPELVTAPGYEDPEAARRSKQKALFLAVGVLGVAVALAGGLWAGKREAALAAKAPRAERQHERGAAQQTVGRAAVQAIEPAQPPAAVEPTPTFDALEAAARSPLLAPESAPVEVEEPVAAPAPAVNPSALPAERPRPTTTASTAATRASSARTTTATKTGDQALSSASAPVTAREAAAVPTPANAERSTTLAQPASRSAAPSARDFQLRD